MVSLETVQQLALKRAQLIVFLFRLSVLTRQNATIQQDPVNVMLDTLEMDTCAHRIHRIVCFVITCARQKLSARIEDANVFQDLLEMESSVLVFTKEQATVPNVMQMLIVLVELPASVIQATLATVSAVYLIH